MTNMSARSKKLQKDYLALFGNIPRGHSYNSKACLKTQIEHRAALLKGNKGRDGKDGKDGKDDKDSRDGKDAKDDSADGANNDEDDAEEEQYTGKLKDRAAKAAAATGLEKKPYNRAVTLTKQVNGMKGERIRYSAQYMYCVNKKKTTSTRSLRCRSLRSRITTAGRLCKRQLC
jgi:hypothetical protein